MRFEKCIHAASVSLKITPVASGDALLRRFGRDPQPQNPLLAVHLHRVFADHFRKFSGSGAPQDVHLPQPILRGHVALGKKQVFERTRLNRRNPVLIAHYPHFGRNPRHGDAAIQLRQRRPRNPVKPPDADDEHHQQYANGVVKNAERRMAPPSIGTGVRNLGQGSSRRHYWKIVGVRHVRDNRAPRQFAPRPCCRIYFSAGCPQVSCFSRPGIPLTHEA